MRDKFLTETMGGKLVNCCTVELENELDIDETCVRQENSEYLITDCTYGKDGEKPEECKYWQQRFIDGSIDFSTWIGFGKLWGFSTKQDWWIDFMTEYGFMEFIEYINPDKFADAIYEYMQK